MYSIRQQLISLIQQGSITPENIDNAVKVSSVYPNGTSWINFLDKLLLWLSGVFLAFSVLFFIAYNWSDIGRFAKFSLVEGLIIVSIILYWKKNANPTIAKVSLLVASILIGVLLALYSQTYQTGADPWQLFFYWALFMLPWTIIARFPVLWIIWLVLMNLTIQLYFIMPQIQLDTLSTREFNYTWIIFLFNTIVLLVWEILALRLTWLNQRWAPRLIAVLSGVAITQLMLSALFESNFNATIIPTTIWTMWVAVIYIFYRYIKPDLFIISGSFLSVIIISISFMTLKVFDDYFSLGPLFILAFFTIILGASAALVLLNINRKWQS